MQRRLKTLLLCGLMISSSLLQAQESDADIEKEVARMANQALAKGFSQKYHEDYLSSIVRFNKRSQKLSKVLVDHGHKKMAQKVQNFELPNFKLQKNHKAILEVGPHNISVTTHDLFKGQIMLNQAPFDITGEVTVEKVRDHLTTYTAIETSWLDLFINRAHAQQSRDPFEIAVFATVTAMQESFNDEWCLFSACKQERAQKNFEQVMATVEEKAQACQNNPEAKEIEEMSFDISDYVEYNSGRINFEDTLEDAFNRHPEQNATCQDFVESFYKDDIEKVAGRGESGGYISGLTSAQAYENRNKNKQAFKDYIQEICNPYIKLRNCLIQNRYSTIRRVFDETRRPGKRGSPSESYEVRPREGSGTRR